MKIKYWLTTAIVGVGMGGSVLANEPVLVHIVHPQNVSKLGTELLPDLNNKSNKIQSGISLSEGKLLPATALRLVNAYADELESQLKDKSTGYAFVVRYRDSGLTAERAGGLARRAPDPNPRAMSVEDRLNIASVSKIITAATLLKLLVAKKKSIDTFVCDLLPPDWEIGANFQTVTVRELLTHHSGVRFPDGETLQNLKFGVESDIKLEDKPVFEYNNSNFGLMRVLIARLAFDNFKPDRRNAAEAYGQAYMSAVNQQVFAPAGLNRIHCKPDPKNPAQCYQFPDSNKAGTDFGDTSNINGSQGWNMSARELSTVGSKLFFSSSNQIMPCWQIDGMVNEQLGIYHEMLTPTVAEFGHNGYYPGKDTEGKVSNAGELNSLLLGFSNGISLAMLINSQLDSGVSPTHTAKQAMATTLAKDEATFTE